MRKDLKTLAALLVLGLGVSVFAVTLVRAALPPPAEEAGPDLPAAATPAAPQTAAGDEPVRLKIQKIGVDAKVQHVGIAKSGKMAVPSNYTDAGWYRYGTAPGLLGSAVIDGHVNNGLSLPGVFGKLSELSLGDEILVVAASGEERRFAVSAIETYHYQEVPVRRLFEQKDKARLNLITCDGTWIAGEKTFDRRLVVYAELI